MTVQVRRQAEDTPDCTLSVATAGHRCRGACTLRRYAANGFGHRTPL